MIHHFRNRNFYVLLLVDAILFVVSLLLAYGIRFSLTIPFSELPRIVAVLPWIISVKLVTFFLMGVYQGMWRYTSLLDLQRLVKASLLATVIIVTGIIFINRFQGYPRSVFIADNIFTIFFCGGFRAAIRIGYAHYRKQASHQEKTLPGNTPQPIRLLIIGAGDAAEKLIRDVQGNSWSAYEIVQCLDDDSAKHHRTLLGIKVQGPINHLSYYTERYKVHEVLIAMPSVTGDRMREIVALCKESGLPFKTIPSLSSLIDGNVTINDLRPVNFEDLLGRPPVKLNLEGIGQYLTGKTIVVTGAGGSIGSELCRQVVRFNPKELVLIEGSEFNLYRIESELRANCGSLSIISALCHVQHRPLMSHIFDHYRPQVVFHAAACKHVPIVEANPWEAVYNNIIGSHVVMDIAEKYGVERFVSLSTDKAVRPTSVMGASKRTVEILLQSRPIAKTRFMAVRFGNVLGSSGSVIPIFQRQIMDGGPVTVTHPEITRFFMTIPEACQLVIQAGSLGEGGEIFILEMGTPVKIDAMARDIIRLSGKEPDRDIKIVYTGLRPGEKLYEELITHGEGIVPTTHEKIMVLRRSNAAGGIEHREILSILAELIAGAKAHDAGHIKATLNRIVPEYTPSDAASVLGPPRTSSLER